MLRSGSACQHVTPCETSCAKLGVITSQPRGEGTNTAFRCLTTGNRQQAIDPRGSPNTPRDTFSSSGVEKNAAPKKKKTCSVCPSSDVPVIKHLYLISCTLILQMHESKMSSLLFITYFLLIYYTYTYKHSYYCWRNNSYNKRPTSLYAFNNITRTN